jgi:GTP-binding protein
MGKNRFGQAGADVVLRVPVGTQVLDEDQETLIADMDQPGERLVLLRGGNGGFGNNRFKGPINRAPRFAMPGQTGEERWIWLRLKLIADVGLVGLPNAGKSTFLAATSAAKPKIADYPFTTVTPNLGVVEITGQERFVMADIPGLIEGASEGAGMGVRFLGHVERTAVLIHLVDGTQEDVAGAWRTVREELAAYGEGLEDKPEILALNKIDALDAETRDAKAEALKAVAGRAPLLVSGVSGEGVTALLRTAFAEVRARRAAEHVEQTAGEDDDEDWRP